MGRIYLIRPELTLSRECGPVCLTGLSLLKLSFESKKDGKDHETIQSSTTHGPGYPMGK